MIGCTHTKVIKVYDIKYSQEKANEYLKLGTKSYKDCHFIDALDYLSQSLVHQKDRKQKARCYIYMGASTFYLGVRFIDSAISYFKKAKRCSRKVIPTRRDFPNEIRELYHTANE